MLACISGPLKHHSIVPFYFNSKHTVTKMHVSFLVSLFATLFIASPVFAWDEYYNNGKNISVGCVDETSIERDQSGSPILALRCEFKGNGTIQKSMVQTAFGVNKLGKTVPVDETKMYYEVKPGTEEGETITLKVGERKSGCDFKWGISYRYEGDQWKFVSKMVLPAQF